MLESNATQNPEALLRMGRALLKQGRLDQAEAALRQVLATQPNHDRALEYLGTVELARRNGGRAAGWLRRAIQAGGGNKVRHNNLAQALLLLNRLQEAVREFEKTLALDPDNRTALMGIGKCLLETGDYERAGGCFQKVEEIQGEDYDALVGRIHCYYQLNLLPLAAQCCRRALELRPDDRDMQLAFGQVQTHLGREKEGYHYLDRLYRDPEYRDQARPHLVQALFALNDPETVEAIAREGLERNGADAEARGWLGRALNVQNRREEALAVLEAAAPDEHDSEEVAISWQQLQQLRGLSEDEVDKVKHHFERLPAERKGTRGTLAFVVAEWYEKHGNLAAQMEWLHQANQLIDQTRFFDPEQTRSYAQTLRTQLTRETLPELAQGGDPDYRPVFILGLPRSGTTLLEQILGAHPELRGVGENPLMPWLFRNRGQGTKAAGVTQLTPEQVRTLADDYRAYMEERFGRERIVEKGILNGREAGLLYAFFPNARFVEIRRHPLDVALGCYKQLFAQQHFSFDPDNLAHEMRVHEDMLAHWHEHLPVPIHTIHYEELVTDQEGTVRDLLDFLELPFDPACLEFQKSAGQVGTASVNQVRQGLYSSAVGRWQQYGDLLDPFREALHRHGLSIPGEDDHTETGS